MGRKKRKAVAAVDEGTEERIPKKPNVAVKEEPASGDPNHQPPPNQPPHESSTATQQPQLQAAAPSNYAMHTHSGEIIQEDIYISDGSEDSDDDDGAELVLSNSRLGIMRRGLHSTATLQQPNRQWTRQEHGAREGANNGGDSNATNQDQQAADELDPAQRAARLLIEKQRREEEQKFEARQKENEDNVSKDPTLFSKRTAFDIRFDQIEEKPWHRGLQPDQVPSAEQLSEYFNYGMVEEDWLEYAQQQLLIRQELVDASRQKRAPDPTVVPIQPKKPETPLTLVSRNEEAAGSNTTPAELSEAPTAPLGPSKTTDTKPEASDVAPKKKNKPLVPVGVGGAWGAGAAPGSKLAKLMEEQAQQQQQLPSSTQEMQQQQQQQPQTSSRGHPDSYYGRGSTEDSYGGPPQSREPRQDAYYGGGRSLGEDHYSGSRHEQSHHQGTHRSDQGDYYGGGGRGRGGYRGGGGRRHEDYDSYGGRKRSREDRYYR